ncbi:MAG: hypothetical protein JW934_12865 [Anaerolineae bacterium]|nr:hypothetical protein [Anaerolineae bacterium]
MKRFSVNAEIVLVSFVILVLLGCIASSTPPPTLIQTPLPTETAMSTATSTATLAKTPTAAPTNTAVPTQTPTSTHTPEPTNTPSPEATFTPTPAPTSTLEPTHTPLPTKIVAPTNTLAPSTNTPRPTNTLQPTHTPIPPTNTPQASLPPGTDILADGVWKCPNNTSGASYVGSDQSDKFHYLSCRWADKIKDENRICFASRAAAVAYGYAPCGVCKP